MSRTWHTLALSILLLFVGCDRESGARIIKADVVAIAVKAARDDGTDLIGYTHREPIYGAGKWRIRFEVVPPEIVGQDFDVFIDDKSGKATIERGD